MKPHRFFVMLSVLVFLAGFSCESSREQKPDAAVVEKPTVSIDTAALLERVQKVRDREFENAPRFREVSDLKPAKTRGTDAYVADRAAVEEVLFGTESEGLLPWIEETRFARYDAKGHVIRYQKGAPQEDLERSLVFAIVEALNQEAFASAPAPTTWDAALAQSAALRGDAALSWLGLRAQAREVGMETLARRPEFVLQLEDARSRLLETSAGQSIHEYEDAFVVREGFTLAAALYRAGGWSAAELARIGPPKSTDHVVRPDRWLGQGAEGKWKFEDEHDKELVSKGWEIDREGLVGPGIVSIWLAARVDPNRSRSIYASWQSDAYRVFRKDGKWWFEWLSLWRTPSDATQVSGALNKGLSQIDGARYEVVDAGASVSVVGTSDASANADLLLARATKNTQVLPVFEHYEKGMVEFVPTTLDRYLSQVEKAELDEEQGTWVDPATGMTMNIESLKDWELQKTDDPSARWVARKGGASILMTTQLVDPLQPDFSSEDFERQVARNFEKSVASAKTRIERVSKPVADSMAVRVSGQFEGGPTEIRARISKVDEVVITFSLKGSPEAVAQFSKDFEALADSIEVEVAEDSGEQGEGIIEFKVE